MTPAPRPPAGPGLAGTPAASLHAAAALEVYRHAADPPQALAFLERLYPKLVAHYAYLTSWRDPDRRGLPRSSTPGSRAWTTRRPGITCWRSWRTRRGPVPPYRRFGVLHADPADRPTDAAYDRFVYLVVTYRDAGYGDARLLERSPFLIQGPLFNAIWRWSAEALAEIARLVGDDPAPHRADAGRIHRAMLRELWDPLGRRFGTRDVRADRRTPEDTNLGVHAAAGPGAARADGGRDR